MAEESQSDDELLAESEELQRRSAAARLFDVRRVIGLLFVVYGLIVGLLGIFDSQSDLQKSQGVRINLWMGMSMLVLGGLFLLWQKLRPTRAPSREELAATEKDDRPPSH
ncbi:MAG TPA: hypothetical protein VFR35_00680 [Actinoplanes sp.]|nr:hypothetical protein [Actinoplanes sp.]